MTIKNDIIDNEKGECVLQTATRTMGRREPKVTISLQHSDLNLFELKDFQLLLYLRSINKRYLVGFFSYITAICKGELP